MDWLSVATLLAERSNRPVVLLDSAGKVRLLNRAMEQATGWRRYEVEGRSWQEYVPSDMTVTTAHWLMQAQRGTLRQHTCEAMTRDGRRMLFDLELTLVGREGEQGLMVTVDAFRPAARADEVPRGPDRDYQISCEPSGFGAIRQLTPVGREPLAPDDVRCFQLFHNRCAPCEDCPLLRPMHDPWPRTTVRRHADRDDCFEIITAEPVSAALARISVRLIAGHMLAAIHDAKVRGLADRAGLSERERSVLTYLLMGRSLDDIAAILELSRSTVKFHQANILDKLGADSRVDLIRLTSF